MRRALGVAVVTALLTSSAAAVHGFTGQPGAGAAPVTNLPDLVSVTVDPTNAYKVRQAATFCFDNTLTATGSAANFLVKTYDANRYLAGVTASPAGDKCAVVTFNPLIVIGSLGSIGQVATGAVTGTGGGNVMSNAPLSGSSLAPRAGQTTGPDLVSATGSPAAHTVTYTFDQAVDAAPGGGTFTHIDATRFGFSGSTGADTLGTAIAQVDSATGTEVVVSFPMGADIGNAARYFAKRDAVRTPVFDGVSASTNAYAPATAWISNQTVSLPGPGTTTLPLLTKAEPQADPSQVKLTYSSDLGSFDATKIIAVFDNGESENGTSSQAVPGSTTSRIESFPADGAVSRDPGGMVSIVSPGAANGSAPPISSVPVGLGAPFTPGLTTGPDLVTATLDSTSGAAAFTFDEAIDPDAIAAPAAFKLVAATGVLIDGAAQSSLSADHKTLTISHPGTSAAAGALAVAGATSDAVGNLQPGAVVGLPQPTPPATPTPTPTASPTATPTPKPDTTVTAKVKTPKIARTKKGKRVLSVPVTAGEGVKVSVRLIRKQKVLARGSHKVAKGKHTVRFSIPKKAKPGKATLRITITDAKGNAKTITVHLVVPSRH